MLTMIRAEELQLAREMGFEYWLDAESNRGWHTCLMTGKKFRGQEAADMLAKQEIAMEERRREIEEQEAQAELEEEFTMFDEKDMIDEIEEELTKTDDTQVKSDGRRGVVIRTINPETIGDTYGAAEQVVPNATLRLAQHVEEKMIEGKSIKLTTIQCVDCGAPREIKVQDAFQVKRCVNCQKKYRNRKRAERRRQQRAESKETE